MTWPAMSGSGAAIGTVPTLIRLCRIPGARWLGTPDASGGRARVLRGGSFDDDEDYLRAAFRVRLVPDYRDDDIGFRLVSSRLRP